MRLRWRRAEMEAAAKAAAVEAAVEAAAAVRALEAAEEAIRGVRLRGAHQLDHFLYVRFERLIVRLVLQLAPAVCVARGGARKRRRRRVSVSATTGAQDEGGHADP